MEATLLIFKVIAFASIIFSILFVSARVYASYIRKVDESFDKCTEDCSCKVGAINDQITDAVTMKPKRKPAKKRVSAIKNDKLVITPVEEKPKRGRKKKS